MWEGIKRILFWLIIGGLFLRFLQGAAAVAQQWLWMRQLGYVEIFRSVLAAKWFLGGAVFVFVFAVTWVNLGYATRVIRSLGDGATTPEGLEELTESLFRFRVWIIGLIAIALGWKFAASLSPSWKTVLDFHLGVRFGQTEPIFGRDVGYYVFSLPFYELLHNNLGKLLLIQAAFVILFYAYFGCIRIRRSFSWVRDTRVAGHLSLLIAVGLGILGWGYYLDRYLLLCKSTGVVYGAGYTADHFTSVAFAFMAVVSVMLAVVAVVSIFTRRFILIVPTIGVSLGLYTILIVVLPAFIQKYEVAPSELQLETPYLKNNIAFTRKAFQLEAVDVQTCSSPSALTAVDLADNQQVVDNIRIWDSKSLLPTFRQTQEMRLYYRFYGVDVDRYHLAEGYHQVLLSARELSRKLPERARTWVNQHLQFTHGYGLVMNFDSKKEAEGLPAFIVDDIPPKSSYGLPVDEPAIYFGEKMSGYRIVGTSVREFDYPKGDQNVYTHYRGTGGVPLDSIAKKLVFALANADINILLSSYLQPQSRIQIWPDVIKRVKTVAPFLALDQDPYLVLSEGKLYWIIDAYTVSRRFPYAEPHTSPMGRVGYIRNSVKVIVDAYNGSVRLYVADPRDPILESYRSAFPGAFKPLSELPGDLKQHLRYPKDFFAIQTDVFKAYHMTDPQVFYNQEDLWDYALKTRPKVPEKKGKKWAALSNSPKKPDKLKPYYMLTSLPGNRKLEYLLMTPFTPRNRDNMISWMTARCDFPQYGQLMVYLLPKERLSYGPLQVKAMINQNTEISQQLSLWDQKGSLVILGDLIVVPIADSFLYVEPVYLTTKDLGLPQLKRVIAIQGDRVAMAPTLQEAVEAAVGVDRPAGVAKAQSIPENKACQQLSDVARTIITRVQEAMKKGKWKDFGEAMNELQQMLTPLPK